MLFDHFHTDTCSIILMRTIFFSSVTERHFDLFFLLVEIVLELIMMAFPSQPCRYIYADKIVNAIFHVRTQQ